MQQNEIKISKGIKKKNEVGKIGSGMRLAQKIYTIKTIFSGRKLPICF